MNPFIYSYPVKVCFGEKAAAKNLAAELAKVGPNVLLAYGGGSMLSQTLSGRSAYRPPLPRWISRQIQTIRRSRIPRS